MHRDLNGFPEAHFVGENAVETVLVKGNEPLYAIHLRFSRLRNESIGMMTKSKSLEPGSIGVSHQSAALADADLCLMQNCSSCIFPCFRRVFSLLHGIEANVRVGRQNKPLHVSAGYRVFAFGRPLIFDPVRLVRRCLGFVFAIVMMKCDHHSRIDDSPFCSLLL